jgi:putative RecB family exonuclease
VHMYALMVQEMLGKLPVRVQLLYLSKPEAIIAVPSKQSVTGVARKSKALWSAIESACARDDFRPHTGPLCSYCSYQAYCPAFGGDPLLAEELRGPGTVITPTLPLASSLA